MTIPIKIKIEEILKLRCTISTLEHDDCQHDIIKYLEDLLKIKEFDLNKKIEELEYTELLNLIKNLIDHPSLNSKFLYDIIKRIINYME